MANNQTFNQNFAMFDPRQFPGLFIWNDAQSVTGTNGVALTSNVWQNLARDTTYASSCSTTATYQTNILNGFPVMQFTTAQFYRFHNTVVNLNDVSMFFVSRNTGTQAASGRIFQTSNLNILYGYWGGYKNALYLQNNPSILNTAPAILSDCNWDIYSFNRSQKGPYTWSRFGSNISIGSSSTGPGFNGLCINTGAFGGETTACQVGEILCYSNALLPEQVRAIEGYLAWKWRLQANLPSYHAYVSSMVFTQPPTPLQMSNAPFIWIDPIYTRYQALTGNNITTLSNLGYSGVNFVSNVAPTALANTNTFNTLSTFRLASGATMTYTGAITSNPRSVVFITRNTAQLANPGFLGILNTSNVTNGQNMYFNWNGTVYNLSIGGAGIAFNVAFNTVTSILNNINFYTLVDTQNTSFNVGTENGTVRTLTNNFVGGYGQGSGVYILNTPGYASAQDLGEFMQFQYDISPAERQMMEGYIAWKWILTGNLPTLHPFKTIPPAFPRFTPMSIYGTSNPVIFGGGTRPGMFQLVLWMDASQDPSANGATVTSAADRSGSGYSIVPVAGNTITFTRPGLNGLGNYNFGANRMTVASFAWRIKGMCAFVTKTNVGNWLYSQQVGALYYNYIYAGNQALANFNQNTISFSDSVNASGVTVTGTAWNIFIFGYNSGTVGTPYRVNGTTRATVVASGSAAADLLVTQPLFLNGNASGQFDTAEVAEVLHFNETLTVRQAEQIEGYLAWKWGLVGNLPVTHPYRTAPP